jgi:hypothetical protein
MSAIYLLYRLALGFFPRGMDVLVINGIVIGFSVRFFIKNRFEKSNNKNP